MGALIYAGIENKVYFIIAFMILVLLGYKAGVLMLLLPILYIDIETFYLNIWFYWHLLY